MVRADQQVTRESCQRADAADALAEFRDEFALPAGLIYLDGNSLGALPKAAVDRAADVVTREWGQDLIHSWNRNQWFELPNRIGDKISQLLGGGPGHCVVSDSTSTNVYKAVAAAIGIQAERGGSRRVIVSERDNFPTDLYIVEGLVAMLGDGYSLRLIDSPGELGDVLGDDTAVVLLTQVNYRTGELWDMAATTAQVHAAGALMVWDLCHSAGAVPIDLIEADADFAVGCTYKYLNGGPGSPAFIWVSPKHVDAAAQPLSGWWGHRAPFAMTPEYVPAAGIRKFLVGTQPIISMATMEIGIDIALRADSRMLRAKSLALTDLFIRLVDERLARHPLELVTPREQARRGSQVSLRHPDGFAIVQALISRGVIGDYREPGTLRFGFAALYNTFTEVWDAVDTLREVLDDELWRDPQFQVRGQVT